MRVLSIDPGYERLGLAVLEKEGKEKVLFSECFKTSKDLEFSERLFLVGSRVEELLKEYKVDYVAIEKVFFTNNQKTAMNVAMVRGAIAYIAKSHGIEVIDMSPNEIKNAVAGYGGAGKSQLIAFLPKIIKIEKEIKYDDEWDAIAIGIAFFSYLRFKTLPKSQKTQK